MISIAQNIDVISVQPETQVLTREPNPCYQSSANHLNRSELLIVCKGLLASLAKPYSFLHHLRLMNLRQYWSSSISVCFISLFNVSKKHKRVTSAYNPL